MYSIKLATPIAFDRIVKLLNPHGYYPICFNPGILRHNILPEKFPLYVDVLSIKYTNTDHVQHIVNTIYKHYKVSIDWEAKNKCGLNLDWNYNKKYFAISMPGYVSKALHKFQNP